MFRKSSSVASTGLDATTSAVALWLAIVVGSLAGQARQETRPTFRGGIDMVGLALTVRDGNERLVTTLARDDFRVLVDGRPVAVDFFSNETHPLAVAIMVNTWGDAVSRLRAVGHELVEALGPSDRALVGSFGNEVAVSPFVTGDVRQLRRVLDEELWFSWTNPLGTALDVAIRALRGETGKRAVVIAGGDPPEMCAARAPCISSARALQRAHDEDVTVYGIRLEAGLQLSRFGLGGAVREMARETGGGYLRLQATDNLQETMAAVVSELRHYYLLGFVPETRDKREHVVSVKVTRPGLTTRTRKVYSLDRR